MNSIDAAITEANRRTKQPKLGSKNIKKNVKHHDKIKKSKMHSKRV
jgi:hypothetical protein